MINAYEIRGDVTAIFISHRKVGQLETLVSTDELARVKNFPNTWFASWDKNNKSYYVRGNDRNESGKRETVRLHRWITKAPEGYVVDHIDHDTLNNTNSNLRVVTVEQNNQNRRSSRKSKTGAKYVYERDGKWLVQLRVSSKTIYIGTYKSFEEAKRKAREARKRYVLNLHEAS